jgi:hypothetical protein
MAAKKTPKQDKFERTLDLIQDEGVKEALSLIFDVLTSSTTPKSKIKPAVRDRRKDEHRRD